MKMDTDMGINLDTITNDLLVKNIRLFVGNPGNIHALRSTYIWRKMDRQ